MSLKYSLRLFSLFLIFGLASAWTQASEETNTPKDLLRYDTLVVYTAIGDQIASRLIAHKEIVARTALGEDIYGLPQFESLPNEEISINLRTGRAVRSYIKKVVDLSEYTNIRDFVTNAPNELQNESVIGKVIEFVSKPITQVSHSIYNRYLKEVRYAFRIQNIFGFSVASDDQFSVWHDRLIDRLEGMLQDQEPIELNKLIALSLGDYFEAYAESLFSNHSMILPSEIIAPEASTPSDDQDLDDDWGITDQADLGTSVSERFEACAIGTDPSTFISDAFTGKESVLYRSTLYLGALERLINERIQLLKWRHYYSKLSDRDSSVERWLDTQYVQCKQLISEWSMKRFAELDGSKTQPDQGWSSYEKGHALLNEYTSRSDLNTGALLEVLLKIATHWNAKYRWSFEAAKAVEDQIKRDSIDNWSTGGMVGGLALMGAGLLSIKNPANGPRYLILLRAALGGLPFAGDLLGMHIGELRGQANAIAYRAGIPVPPWVFYEYVPTRTNDHNGKVKTQALQNEIDATKAAAIAGASVSALATGLQTFGVLAAGTGVGIGIFVAVVAVSFLVEAWYKASADEETFKNFKNAFVKNAREAWMHTSLEELDFKAVSKIANQIIDSANLLEAWIKRKVSKIIEQFHIKRSALIEACKQEHNLSQLTFEMIDSANEKVPQSCIEEDRKNAEWIGHQIWELVKEREVAKHYAVTDFENHKQYRYLLNRHLDQMTVFDLVDGKNRADLCPAGSIIDQVCAQGEVATFFKLNEEKYCLYWDDLLSRCVPMPDEEQEDLIPQIKKDFLAHLDQLDQDIDDHMMKTLIDGHILKNPDVINLQVHALFKRLAKRNPLFEIYFDWMSSSLDDRLQVERGFTQMIGRRR